MTCIGRRVGRMGEFLAAYLFELHGYEAVHVDRDGADLWVKLPDGRIVTVDVKACSQTTVTACNNYPHYQFNCSAQRRRPDFYAMVALDTRLMVVFPGDKIAKNVKLKPARFSEDIMRESIERMAA